MLFKLEAVSVVTKVCRLILRKVIEIRASEYEYVPQLPGNSGSSTVRKYVFPGGI